MISILAETEDYKVQTEESEGHCFVHIDVENMNKKVLGQLRGMLDNLLAARQGQVCFYSTLEESFRLAESLRPLDAIVPFEQDGVEAKVGIWEYK